MSSEDDVTERPQKRNADGTFVKGAGSPNPGGSPKWVKAMRDALKECAEQDAVPFLRRMVKGEEFDVMTDDGIVRMPGSLDQRLKASEVVVSYTMAKPTKKVKVAATVKSALPSGLTPEQAMEIAKQPLEEK